MESSTGFRVNENGYIIEDAGMPPRHEHGTAIALIIRQIYPDVRFDSINILDDSLATDGRILLTAIEHAIALRPDIIHLSLGTTKWRYILPLKRMVKDAHDHNIILVSAAHNHGLRSYPAYLKGVIGVKAERLWVSQYMYKKPFFYASCTAQGIRGIEALHNGGSAAGSSMAAAYLAGYAASVIGSNIDHSWDKVFGSLQDKAANITGVKWCACLKVR
jgi:hypothetical protein